MGGFNIGIGVGLRYPAPYTARGKIIPPTYLSCFGTGIWEMEGIWISEDTWEMQSTNPPFLPAGIWNNEGVFRFKDEFNFGTSFLPTGFVIYDGVYRYKDKIKVETQKEIKSTSRKGKIDKSYWNFLK